MSGLATDRRTLLAVMAAAGLWPTRLPAAPAAISWGVDYGATSDPAVARSFSLLVLEPDHARPIAPLRGPGSKLLGYISLGEVERSRPYVADLDAAGALRTPNPNWPDARLADLRNAAWPKMVVDKLVPAILAKGYDGLFLDTLDNAAAMENSDPRGSRGMVAAAVDLVGLVRRTFPNIAIMMNRGYALLPQAATSIDMLVGEAMASRWNFKSKRYEYTSEADWKWQADHLRGAQKANASLMLATLDYWDPADQPAVSRIYERERAAGFHPYVATLALDRLLPEPRS